MGTSPSTSRPPSQPLPSTVGARAARIPAILWIVLLALAAATGVTVFACASGGADQANVSGDDGGGDGAGGGPDATSTGDGGHVDAGCGSACQCSPTGPPSSCAAAMDLGVLQPGQMASATGNIVPVGSQAYVSVTFTGNATQGYHPQIALTTGETEFAFDVASDCSGTLLGCDDQSDASSGTSTWEEYYEDGGDFTNADAFVPIPPSGDDGGVIVRVYRRPGQAASCNQYTLTVSE